MAQPYHKFVFDTEKRTFVGNFDEMYRMEDVENFDSWEQENNMHLAKQLVLAVISRYSFNSILDYGCGKGYFTSLLLNESNKVSGTDISSAAIEKAKSHFPKINFSVLDDKGFIAAYNNKHDLIITMEVLSYIENWKEMIAAIARNTEYYLLTLYLPENPIGFVKTFDDLKNEVKKHFDIETELMINNEQLLILAKSK